MAGQKGAEHFVKYGDIEALSEITDRVLSDGCDKKALSQIAKTRYSKERMSDEYLNLYKDYAESQGMRVLLIDVNCKYSSTGKIVYDLYTTLRKKGHKAAICYGRGKLIKEPGIYKFGLDWETYLHGALSRLTGYNGCFSYFSTKRLLQFIDKFKPDIVHIHELHGYFVNIGPLLMHLKKKGIKVAWTFHCEYMYTGKCGYSYECEKWKAECGNCPHLQDYPKTVFFDHTRKMFRRKKELLKDLDMVIVTPSKWLAKRVRESFLKDKKVKVIQNGIDISVFRSVDDALSLKRELGIPEKNKVVLSVAPNIMSARKGGTWVIQLSERMRDKNITFVLVGGKVQRQRGNVIEVGKIYDKRELARYYSMADAFVICSQREVFPTTCIEAQCCGVPIVGFDEGGVRETQVG